MVGPLVPNDWPDIHTSPFGVIPKSTPGKWRLITTLYVYTSYSVNDGIRRVLAFFYVVLYITCPCYIYIDIESTNSAVCTFLHLELCISAFFIGSY